MRDRRALVGALFVGLVGILLFLPSCGSAPEPETTTTSQPATTTTTTPAVDKSKFQDAWRAYKQIEAALTVGVSYAEFGSLVQNFITELSLVPQGSLTTGETAVLVYLYDIGQAYVDSYTLWKRKIDQKDYVSTKFDGAWVSCIIVKGAFDYIPEYQRMADTYGLRVGTQESPVPGKPAVTVMPDDSFKTVWAWASARGESLASTLAP